MFDIQDVPEEDRERDPMQYDIVEDLKNDVKAIYIHRLDLVDTEEDRAKVVDDMVKLEKDFRRVNPDSKTAIQTERKRLLELMRSLEKETPCYSLVSDASADSSL